MKKLALVLVVLALFVAPAVAGTLTVLAVPDAAADGTPGQVKLEFWAAGFTAVGGIEVKPTFTLNGADVTSLFSLKKDPANATFLGPDGGYDVKQNVQWPAVFGFVALPPASGQPYMAGFMGLGLDVNCTNPTLVMSATFNYSQLANGAYVIDIGDGVGLANSGGQLQFDLVKGNFTVGQVVPEPCTMALLGCGLVGLLGYGRKRIRK